MSVSSGRAGDLRTSRSWTTTDAHRHTTRGYTDGEYSFPAPGRDSGEGVPGADGHFRLQARKGDRRPAVSRISAILAGDRAITADTGLRLSKFLGMSEGFWVGLQVDYDMSVARDELGKKLDKIETYHAEAA